MPTERTYYRIPPIAAGFNHTIVITYPPDTWDVLQLGSGNLRIDFREKVTEPVLLSLYSTGDDPIGITRNNTDKSLTINIPGGDTGSGMFVDYDMVMFDIAQEINGNYYPVPGRYNWPVDPRVTRPSEDCKVVIEAIGIAYAVSSAYGSGATVNVNPPGPFNTSIIEPFADGWMVASSPGLVISGGADAAFFEVRDIDYQGEMVTAGLFKGTANIDDPQDANRDNVYEVSFVYDGGGPDDFGVLVVRPVDMHLSYPDTATNTPPITFQTGQVQNDTDPHTPDPDYLMGVGADCYFFATVDFAVPQDANGDNVYEAYFHDGPGGKCTHVYFTITDGG